MGMIAGTIGSLQALEAVKVILGAGDIMAGRVLFFDGLDLSFREMKLERNRNCRLCGENPSIKEPVQYEMNYCASKIRNFTKYCCRTFQLKSRIDIVKCTGFMYYFSCSGNI
jgi:hypothetical protein